MKTKTIKSVLTRKFDSWVKSIEDKDLQNLVKENTIITGGCIASMLLQEDVNDYDFYFRTLECAELIAKYYVDRFEQKNKKGIPCKISVQKDQYSKQIKIVVKSSGIASEEGTNKPYEYFEGSQNDSGEYVQDIITNDPEKGDDIHDELNESLDKKALDLSYKPIFLTSNAITLTDKIQLIIRFTGDPDEIHKNFDYVHCMNYWTSWNKKLSLHIDALEALLTKELVYKGSLYPICSLIRMRKFIKRGWTINAGQILKMCFQIHELDLNNQDVLAEQLIGVDTAYFLQFIKALKASNSSQINTAYLIEIVDRLL